MENKKQNKQINLSSKAKAKCKEFNQTTQGKVRNDKKLDSIGSTIICLASLKSPRLNLKIDLMPDLI